MSETHSLQMKNPGVCRNKTEKKTSIALNSVQHCSTFYWPPKFSARNIICSSVRAASIINSCCPKIYIMVSLLHRLLRHIVFHQFYERACQNIWYTNMAISRCLGNRLLGLLVEHPDEEHTYKNHRVSSNNLSKFWKHDAILRLAYFYGYGLSWQVRFNPVTYY